MMKKIVVLALAAMMAGSCSYKWSTSTSSSMPDRVNLLPQVCEVEVSPVKVRYEYSVGRKESKRLSKAQLIESAVSYVLKENGDAVLLIQPEFTFVKRVGIKKITVSGYPATYRNFHTTSMDELERVGMDIANNRSKTCVMMKVIRTSGNTGSCVTEDGDQAPEENGGGNPVRGLKGRRK